MPIFEIKKNNKIVGFRWGDSGKVYLVRVFGMDGARQKAVDQARAVFASGYQHKKDFKKHAWSITHV